MNQQEASRVVSFLINARPINETMKGHIVNSINALLNSSDPISNRFTQIFTESVNRSATMVLNESVNPELPPQAMQPFNKQQQVPSIFGMSIQPNQSKNPEVITEAITNRAAMLLA